MWPNSNVRAVLAEYLGAERVKCPEEQPPLFAGN
jgi:hypothetical protein